MSLTKKEKEQAIIDVWRKSASAMLVDGPSVDEAFNEIKQIINGGSEEPPKPYSVKPLQVDKISFDINDDYYESYENANVEHDPVLMDVFKIPMVKVTTECGEVKAYKSSDVVRIESNKKSSNPTQAEALLYSQKEKYIMTLIRDAYILGRKDGLTSFGGEVKSRWYDTLPEYENNVHETIETITGAKYY